MEVVEILLALLSTIHLFKTLMVHSYKLQANLFQIIRMLEHQNLIASAMMIGMDIIVKGLILLK